ncbi:hypothetical protein CTAYLR_010217 [Chrysophaeum taylorii]|uniref:Uncharacterized protein n=1 Tax=Chrysophaeum taylorii TaxID=2483200 RepID=A0AAD7XHV1_9STRA|nr:hypothetical protein CTAYLR_010217 [Chrysophaeum taylorii]
MYIVVVFFFVFGCAFRATTQAPARAKIAVSAEPVSSSSSSSSSTLADPGLRRLLLSSVATRIDEEYGDDDVSKNLRTVARLEAEAAEARLGLLVEAVPDLNPRHAVVLARLAAWFNATVRPVATWKPPRVKEKGDAVLEDLVAHLLEKYPDVPAGLRSAPWLAGDADEERVAYRFSRAYESVGRGDKSARDALRDLAGIDGLTKKAAAAFCQQPADEKGPLPALRRAQCEALGLPSWVADSVCRARCARFFAGDERFFSHEALPWIARHATDLEGPHVVTLAVDFFEEMRRADPKYSTSGRTPKTVAAAMDTYALTTVDFADDEPFLPNPRGLRPMFKTGATIPRGTVVAVPYDDPRNGGRGPYRVGAGTDRGAIPSNLRVEEIRSLKRLIYEGTQLDNCLENRRDSQIKYLLRARNRVSSFWSFTISGDSDDSMPKHILLLEVWHLHDGNIVRQAEGPRPRTLPSPEAWYWMQVWCEANDVDWTTWGIYSRLDQIRPCDPL